MPTAPEVPRPVQAYPVTTDESPATPAAGATPSYPVPGGTPAYPGWESASESPASGGRDDRDGTDVPPSAAQPSRYDPPTSPEGFPAASHRQPEQFGQPEEPEEPAQAGQAEQAGKPAQAGSFEQARPSGQPEQAGQAGQAGQPGQAGPSEQPAGGFPADSPRPGAPYGGPAAPYGGPAAPYGGPVTPPGGPSAPYGEATPEARRGPGDEAPTENISGMGPYGTPPSTGAHAGRPDDPSRQPPYAPPAGGPSYPSGGPPQGGLSYPSGQPYQAVPPGGAYPGGPAYPGGTPYPAYPGDDWSRKQDGGLGTAALVLGIVSLFLLVVCGLGALTAIVGLIIGIAAVVKNSNRGRAWVGIALSVLTLIIAVVVLSWFYSKVGDCLNLPPEFQQRCIQEKFGGQFTP
ncbi:hypothetical protein AB0J63_18275 [Streptosporangium canum]|uniref:hypothetical protein n=1 Tax=Streptosporangium canum TaxID=324952 RepID=UPI003444990B